MSATTLVSRIYLQFCCGEHDVVILANPALLFLLTVRPALQISAALVYLHSHSISKSLHYELKPLSHTSCIPRFSSISSFSVFRDLKPANIGFDVRGDGKNLKEQPLMICIESKLTYDTSHLMLLLSQSKSSTLDLHA